jgi:predicted ATP-dependent Lon-type protease
MDKNFEDGIVLATELFTALNARGKKWKARNVPAYVREYLWIPYYITEKDGVVKLFVIRPPDPHNPKVHFREYSQ